MKILALHSDYIIIEPKKKAIKSAEAAEKAKQEIKECLVVFTAVEKSDEKNTKDVVKKLVENIKDISSKVQTKKIVLYPYAHLSSDLGSPQTALQILKDAEKALKKDFEVTRAPFGWYKAFTISCKGHPLSELSREIKSECVGEEVIDQNVLIQKLSRINTGYIEKGKKGLKSNVELGRELDLFIFSEIVGSGLPLLTPRGTTIKREIEKFVTDEEISRGYLYTSTPIIAKSDLYKISGHWQHYKHLMFILDIGKETFALRPMTCPFHFIIYKSKPRSYRDLPLKYAEMSTLFRNESSGELMGLTRLRQFTLADAHIICKEDQLEKEFEKVFDLVNYITKKLGVKDIWYRFSKWDPKDKKKYIDNPKAWEASQESMRKILDKLKVKYTEADGEAAFYGPKLDLQYNNVFGKEDTLVTIQIDFALPERYDLTYTDKDGKEKRPMVIHRSSSGCTERTMAYILEKTQGKLPLWLNPLQVKVITVTDRNIKFSEKVLEKLKENRIRAEIDDRTETIGKKVREAQLEKANYMVTIGDKEDKAKTLAVRSRDGKVKFGVKVDDFINQLVEEIENKE